MTTPTSPDQGSRDSAGDDPACRMSLYFAGALSAQEVDAVDQRLREGDHDLRTAFVDLQESVIALSASAAPVSPPARVREAVMNRIRSAEMHQTATSDQLDDSRADRSARAQNTAPATPQIWRNWQSDSSETGLYTLYSDGGAWEPTGAPGVEVRRLFVDRAANRMTAMFRMTPGAEYPEHRHDGHEECYVLDGDLHVGDEIVMRRGDYQRAESGSPHARQWTQGGCLLLVSTSLSDEMQHG